MFLPAAAVVAAVAGLVAFVGPVSALMIAIKAPVQRALSADVVVVGKVTGIAKDDVEANAPFAGSKEKLKYKVATVKIATGLAGADKMTEIKIGFVAAVKPDPNAPVKPIIRPRPGFQGVELKEGQELLLFVTKHPTGDFYIIGNMDAPIDVTTEQGKKELESIKKLTTTLADPMKSLKSDKPEVRGETATALVMKYRSYPAFGGEVAQVALGADESKLILKGLIDGEWSNNFRGGAVGGLSAMQAFYSLGLTEKDGWVAPVIANVPGAPPVDYAAVNRDAFAKWVDGAGAKYLVKKVVAKKLEEK